MRTRVLSAEVDRGSTVAEVARRYEVQARTLSWWRWRLKKVARVNCIVGRNRAGNVREARRQSIDYVTDALSGTCTRDRRGLPKHNATRLFMPIGRTECLDRLLSVGIEA